MQILAVAAFLCLIAMLDMPPRAEAESDAMRHGYVLDRA